MPAEPTLDPGPTVTEHSVIFRLADLEHEHAAVRLYQEVRVPGDRLAFAHDGTSWVLELDRPDVDRMEYLFQVIDPDGSHRWVTDPANPLRAPGGLDDRVPAPLLLVHDGPEYDELAGLTSYLGSLVRSGELPPLRAALL